MAQAEERRLKIRQHLPPWIYAALVLLLAYSTYARNYTFPPHLYWDENYHIAAAQKYINNVFFMEPHPPLGKLLIALGEVLFHPNEGLDTSPFLTTDHIKEIPKNYSFKGVRFFPVIAAWLSAVLFFLSLYFISRNAHTAFLFSFLYIFDNALVVHSRGAMLDSIQLFFILATTTYALFCVRRLDTKFPLVHYAALGCLSGLALAVKANSAIILLIFPALFFFEFREKLRQYKLLFSSLVVRACVALLCCLVPFLTAWWIHFALGKTHLEDRFYGASEEYKQVLASGETASLRHFPMMFRDSFKFFDRYERGVPKLDVCKVGENGSFPLTWLLGKKSINYRWEKTKDGRVQYLILQSNPVAWLIGLAGLTLALTLVLARIFFGLEIQNTHLFAIQSILLVMYLAYMAVMLELDRTMYLYHYFIPLLLTFYLAYCVLHYSFEKELRRGDLLTYLSLALFAGQIIAAFNYFEPLTYYQPLAAYEVYNRAWFSLWELVPIL